VTSENHHPEDREDEKAASSEPHRPRKAKTDGLPPAAITETGGPIDTEAIHGNRKGVDHRASPIDEPPVPSERQFEPVDDDRALPPRKGPPLPEADERDREE
jgi:hypothetical protein